MKLEFIEAGEIVSTHGVKGEMKVLPWSDGPDFLVDFSRVRIDGIDYQVEICRIQKTCNLLKLKGIDSIESAQKLRGKTVEIYRSDVSDELIFAAELFGMQVVSDGSIIGSITDVLDYPGNKVYVVEGDYKYMIPAVKEFVLSTDLDANIMQVRIIEGMRTDES
jgi:16S rRNA processing protein RimM